MAELPPNQRLNLIPTVKRRDGLEPGVDDFARAKQTVTIGRDLPRADWIPSLRYFVAGA